ncbi:MAG TPA: hypothetical protein VFL57_21680 [Bryobacteraceae bacterium]|nr:hypothetical protein [Bryobacteraceae bacterium]
MLWLIVVLIFVPCLTAAELPVREVVLYKHGVGYFERSGRLVAGETARLEFKASDMNDVLKSLTLHGGAAVRGLRYQSSDPTERRLSEFPFRLNVEDASLPAFLNQLKGARAELATGTEKVAGAILSARVLAGPNQSERQELVLLLETGQIRTYDLAAITGMTFADTALQNQLREYLRVLSEARAQDKRTVFIDAVDSSGAREVTASYAIPAPVWKSSYRLIFGEKETTLEGWAIVDNTTADDWTNVRLALVSGKPVSFISRLYEVRYVQRPVAELPEERAQRPVVYEGSVAQANEMRAAAKGKLPAAAPREFSPPAAALRDSLAAAPTAGLVTREEAAQSNVAVETAAREAGELFEYGFRNPVTVRRGESAMLPFLQQPIAARKLLIYSDANSVHPMNAAELTNNTGKTLDGGPITVYDAGTYAGEALVETVKIGDKRLISYGVDLGTRITAQFDSHSDVVREIHARRGTLTIRHAQQETRTHTIHNVDQKPKTLVIQHAVRPGYKLLNQKPTETTPTAYRFEVKLAPGTTEKFPISEERLYEESTLITNLSSDILLTYVQNKTLSEAARRALGQVLALKRQQADIASRITGLRQQLAALERDQQRMRQNIDSLNRVSGQQEQVQRYAKLLAEQEARIADLRTREGELEQKRLALESELNSAIEKIEF